MKISYGVYFLTKIMLHQAVGPKKRKSIYNISNKILQVC